MTRLQASTTYAQLQRYTLDQGWSDSALRELLGLLNSIGTLHRKRTAVKWLRAIGIHCLHLMLGIAYKPLSYRKNTTIYNIGVATLRAATPVFLAIGVVAGVAIVAGVLPLRLVILFTLYWTFLLHVSIVGHELAHVLVLKRKGFRTDILQLGMYLGVIHPVLPAAIEIRSSILGPLAGVAICGLSAMATAWAGHPLLAASSVCVGLCHGLSLLPLYGDGISLKKALRARYFL